MQIQIKYHQYMDNKEIRKNVEKYIYNIFFENLEKAVSHLSFLV